MKTFVILLLLTNLAYFGWNQGWLRDVEQNKPAAAANKPQVRPFDQAPMGLTLLAELPPEEVQLRANMVPASEVAAAGSNFPAAAPDSPPPPAVPALHWCANLGQFEREGEATALIPELSAMGLEVELQSSLVPVSSVYWVYMPKFATDAAAYAMLEELREKEIDSYYMRNGQLAGGISLGVFSRRAGADQAQASLLARGYESTITEIFREEVRWRLALEASTQTFPEGPDWQAFRAANRALTVSENVCEVVASPTQFP